MKLTWIGHSCFKLEDDGYTVIFDPYQDQAVPGLTEIRESADLILCSHDHSDHGAKDKVSQLEGKENPYTVTEIPTFHDDRQGTLRGNNLIHLLDNGKYRIAHFGDIGCELTEEQASVLTDLDVAMIPVGGYYTVDAQGAKKIVDKVCPKIVIPMHYRGDDFGFDVISTVDDFLNLCDQVLRLDGSSLEPDEKYFGQTIVLEPQNRI